MGKAPAAEDMFGIDDDDDDDTDYVILGTMAAPDGWRAVFKNPLGGSDRILGLAGFAFVEVIQEEDPNSPPVPPIRTMRPMVMNEFGQIDDAAMFDDFICVVPPGGDVLTTAAFARQVAAAQAMESKK